MKQLFALSLFAAFTAAAAFGAAPPTPSVSHLFDQQLTMLEHELVPLVEAMPADKFDFAPTDGNFKGVRTFGQQASHVAAVMYSVSAAILQEKNPSETGKSENGPASLKTKDDIVKYLKGAFAYSHKAMGSLTQSNIFDMVPSPFGGGKVPRLSIVDIPIWHSFDHYGQMVVYLRMNGIVPPASRR